MKNKIDYVISSNAQAWGNGMYEAYGAEYSNQVGTMVGTKNYFFFFPNTTEWRERKSSKKYIIHRIEYELGGLPVEEFIKNKLEQDHLSIDEFEKYALELADPDNKEESWFAWAFPFSDIKQIKMQINFFFATITINYTDQRIKGWLNGFLKVGKQKKDVKEFYSKNPIIK
jgi:hypothetical protein